MISKLHNAQLWQLILANARELLREPAVLFWWIAFPILMSLGLGIAFTKKKDVTVTIAVIGRNHLVHSKGDSASLIQSFLQINGALLKVAADGRLSRELYVPDERLGGTTYIFHDMSWKQAMVMLKRGNQC